MSVGQRSLCRLPLHIFYVKKGDAHSDGVYEDVYDENSSVLCDIVDKTAAALRTEIGARLLALSSKAGASEDAGDLTDRNSTVGDLLLLPPAALTRALDPLLTYGTNEASLLYLQESRSLTSTWISLIGLDTSSFNPFTEECRRFIENVSIHCAPRPTTALSLLTMQRDLSSQNGIPSLLRALDQHLKGGIRLGTITELVGHASAGKTQFAMQLAVSAAHLHLGTIFIDTEQKLSIARLQAIASERFAISHRKSTNSPQRREHPDSREVLANVTVHSPHSSDELYGVLSSLEDEILARSHDDSRFPVKLIVLDSIAAPARRDFGSDSAPQRATVVIQSAQILKRLADEHQLAVLVINQVGGIQGHQNRTDAGPDNPPPAETISEVMARTDSAFQAALGTSWYHCVTSRMQLEMMPTPNLQIKSMDPSVTAETFAANISVPEPRLIVRRCSIVKSNVVAPARFLFAVTNVGIVDVPEPGECG